MRARRLPAVVILCVLVGPAGARAGDDELIERLSDAVAHHAPGFEPSGQATIAHLAKKGKKTFEHVSQPATCTRFIAVGRKDSFRLGMRVARGKSIVGETARYQPTAMVDACTSSAEKMRVTVKTPAFGGDFIFAAYTVPAGKALPKSALGARMSVIVDKKIPGAKLVAVPATAVMKAGSTFSQTVAVKAGTCYKFAAVGGAGVKDVDIAVKSKAQVLTQDGSSGDHPVVEHCPNESGMLVVQVRLDKGHGAVLASAFEAPASAILVGTSDAHAALDARLRGEADIYAPDMSIVGVIKRGDIVNKKPVYHELHLAKGVCYKLIAVGGAGINDLDIQLRKSKGKGKKGVLATDTTDDDAPIASHCADDSGGVVAKLVSKGSGIYSFAVFAGASASAGATAGYKELETALLTEAGKLGDEWKAAGSVDTAVVGAETVASFELKMLSDECYGLLAVGLGDIKALSMEVVAEGNKLASTTKAQSDLFVEVCPAKDTVATVKLSAPAGHGPLAYTPYRKPSGVDQVFIPVGGLKKSYISTAIRKLHDKHGKGRQAVTELLEGSLQTAEAETFEVELEGERCYTIIATGNPSVKELHVKLFSPMGAEVASGEGQGRDVVVHTSPCPKWNGTYELRVEMYMGYGKFGAQLFGD